MNSLDKIKERFPDRDFELKEIVASGFSPRKQIIVDKKKLKASWSVELEQELIAFHGTDIESTIQDTIIKELTKQIPPLPILTSKWRILKKKLKYLSKRK